MLVPEGSSDNSLRTKLSDEDTASSPSTAAIICESATFQSIKSLPQETI